MEWNKPMANPEALYLSQDDVKKVNLPMQAIIELVERAFHEKGNQRVEMPPKPGIHTQPDAFIHAMPAYIPAMKSAGIKWVSGYPENQSRGLPYISGLLILNDVETGLPYAIMDCVWITAFRTAAATAIAAKYLANPKSRTAGILACGVQGRTNLEALQTLFPLEKVWAYDIVPDVLANYVAQMSKKLGLEIIPVEHPEDAVRESDLVVTSGPILKHPRPTIQAGWLKPGGFGSAVDFDSYWSGEALAEMDKISTDDHAQFEYYRSAGYFQSTPDPYADLGEIVIGSVPLREDDHQRILAINLGLAIDDMAVGPEVYRRAMQMGIGTRLSL
jgi:ornithine cyclodeaminase/alanine dehydrogenase-like protein (mu-crystallin family)